MAYYDPALPRLFHALADPTRLAVVEALLTGPASVGDLAQPFDMALPSFLKHLKVLEEAGAVSSEKQGRVRMVRLNQTRLDEAARWFLDRRRYWDGRLDRLESLLSQPDEASP